MYYYAVINTVYTRARIGSKRDRVCVVYGQSTVPHMDAVLSGCAIVHVKTPFIYSSILSSIIFSHSHLLSHSSYVIYTAKRVCVRANAVAHALATRVPLCHVMPCHTCRHIRHAPLLKCHEWRSCGKIVLHSTHFMSVVQLATMKFNKQSASEHAVNEA